jgi:DNA-binding NarL/FixJ family response regulator
MKNEKKVIEIISEFPAILYSLKHRLKSQENLDYILDASNYSKPLALLNVSAPDILLLNLQQGNDCTDLVGREMQNNAAMGLGMITRDPTIYYMSLCSTLHEKYFIDKSIDLECIPEAVSKQQLN